MSDILEFNEENFTEEVLEAETPVLVDFAAVWCAPCHRQLITLKEFAEKHTNIKVGKVDIDQSAKLASEYRIRAVPTLVLFVNGKATHTKVGQSSISVMEDMLTLLESSR